MTQIDQVRRHLKAGKSITPATAIAVYGIFRLAVAIDALRNSGMQIDVVLRWDEVGKRYGEYRLRRTITVGDVVQVKSGQAYGLPSWVRSFRAAPVIGCHPGGSVLVRFIRGANSKDEWMLRSELVNAG